MLKSVGGILLKVKKIKFGFGLIKIWFDLMSNRSLHIWLQHSKFRYFGDTSQNNCSEIIYPPTFEFEDWVRTQGLSPCLLCRNLRSSIHWLNDVRIPRYDNFILWRHKSGISCSAHMMSANLICWRSCA